LAETPEHASGRHERIGQPGEPLSVTVSRSQCLFWLRVRRSGALGAWVLSAWPAVSTCAGSWSCRRFARDPDVTSKYPTCSTVASRMYVGSNPSMGCGWLGWWFRLPTHNTNPTTPLLDRTRTYTANRPVVHVRPSVRMLLCLSVH